MRGDAVRDLHFFLKKPVNRVWIRNEAINLYVRKSTRIVEGREFAFLDLANIEVAEKYQNQGFFQSLLKEILEFKDLNFYAENVCSDVSEHIFRKFNFKPVNLDHLQSSPIMKISDFYLIQNENQNS
jgi:predicted N-acetyltransferase YhbS